MRRIMWGLMRNITFMIPQIINMSNYRTEIYYNLREEILARIVSDQQILLHERDKSFYEFQCIRV